MVQKQVGICLSEEYMQCQKVKRKTVSLQTNTSFFCVWKDTRCHTMLLAPEDEIFRGETSRYLPRTIVWYVRILSEKIIASLRSFVLVA